MAIPPPTTWKFELDGLEHLVTFDAVSPDRPEFVTVDGRSAGVDWRKAEGSPRPAGTEMASHLAMLPFGEHRVAIYWRLVRSVDWKMAGIEILLGVIFRDTVGSSAGSRRAQVSLAVDGSLIEPLPAAVRPSGRG